MYICMFIYVCCIYIYVCSCKYNNLQSLVLKEAKEINNNHYK